MSTDYDEKPIPFELTPLGHLVGSGQWMTTDEAATMLGVERDAVAVLAAFCRLAGVKSGRRWLLDRRSVQERAARPRRTPGPPAGQRLSEPRLPAGPLLRQIELRGGLRACGVMPGSPEEKAFYRAAKTGHLTIWAADRLSVGLLGMTPLEVWGPTAA